MENFITVQKAEGHVLTRTVLPLILFILFIQSPQYKIHPSRAAACIHQQWKLAIISKSCLTQYHPNINAFLDKTPCPPDINLPHAFSCQNSQNWQIIRIYGIWDRDMIFVFLLIIRKNCIFIVSPLIAFSTFIKAIYLLTFAVYCCKL